MNLESYVSERAVPIEPEVLAWLQAVLRSAEFNPDQARDERGQWTSTGGSFLADDVVRSDTAYDEGAGATAEERHDRYLERIQETADNDSGQSGKYAGLQQEALDDYTGDGFRRMNAVLQGNSDSVDSVDTSRLIHREYDTLRPAEQAALLQETIDNAPHLKESVIVYRGLKSTLLEAEHLPSDGVVQLNGFQSATFSPHAAIQFSKRDIAESNPGTLLEIKTTSGLAMGQHSRGGEGEFIIGHGEYFKIIGAKMLKFADYSDPLKVWQLEHVRRKR